MVGKIWGLPVVAVIKFLESEKITELHIPVHGDITDPSFEVSKAFRAAFQDSMKQHTRTGISLLKEGTTKIASGATKASGKFIMGMGGAVTDLVTTTTSEITQQVLPGTTAASNNKSSSQKASRAASVKG